MDKPREEKFWICLRCADKKNWDPPTFGVMLHKGLCGHCNRKDESILLPKLRKRYG